jgi:hypothetical protein
MKFPRKLSRNTQIVPVKIKAAKDDRLILLQTGIYIEPGDLEMIDPKTGKPFKHLSLRNFDVNGWLADEEIYFQQGDQLWHKEVFIYNHKSKYPNYRNPGNSFERFWNYLGDRGGQLK